MKIIPYGKQSIGLEDISIVSKSLKKNKITTGNFVKNFEIKISNFLNSSNTLVCNSGTAGLHIVFESLGLRKGKNIIMPIINFISAYRIAKFLDAKIYFADVDEVSGQMTSEHILKCIKKNSLKKVDFVLTMYLGGYPEDFQNIYKLKKKYKFKLIEDACHAFGAKYMYQDKLYKVGCCKHADASVFSFHPLKTITTGEGGAVSFKSKKNFDIGKKFLSHGIERKKNHWTYDIVKLGMNYRLSDINCALGISQLKKINKFIKKRKEIYKIYESFFLKYRKFFSLPNYNNKNKPSYHLFIVHFNFKKIKIQKDKIFHYYLKNKIFLQQHYIPIFSFKIWNKKANFPGAKNYINSCFSFPIFYDLSKKEINHILAFTKKIIQL